MAQSQGVEASSSLRIFIAKSMLTLSLILVLLTGGFWVYITWMSPSLLYTSDSQNGYSQGDIAGSKEQATQYMNALLQQHYDIIWSKLHPQIQAMWPNQTAFARYSQARFQGYKLQSFALGKASTLTHWTNPETMLQYNNVANVAVSLQIISQMFPQQQSMLAPQFQEPEQLFQNVPLIMQKGQGGQWLILNGGPGDPEAPILPPFTAAAKVVQAPILMYHHISDVPPKNILDKSLTVSPTIFSKQLDYLKAQGYHSITLNQLMNALYYVAPLPEKPIILTFDDGYNDAYKFAYPILKVHGFSGMFYIITGKVGWQGQMTWEQMREMLANGMQIGDHTIHHSDMGQVYLASHLQAQQEVQISQVDLQKHLGIAIQHFCYPTGAPFKGHNLALQQGITSMLALSGYVDATTDPGPTGVIQDSEAPFRLLRLRIDGRDTLQSFMQRFA